VRPVEEPVGELPSERVAELPTGQVVERLVEEPALEQVADLVVVT
jgi:hypothetical protein